MINNDVLRAIRYMLDLGDAKVAEVEIVHLADAQFALTREDVQAFLKKDEEPGYVECGNACRRISSTGLHPRRGRDDSLPPRPVEKRVTNNVVLKTAWRSSSRTWTCTRSWPRRASDFRRS